MAGQTIINLGTGGADLNGTSGSTTGADSNDPKWLDWPGDNAGSYVYLPGVAANAMSVGDSAALDITGDIDIRVQVALDDWTPAAQATLLAKYTSGAGLLSYLLDVNTAGTLRLLISSNGSSATSNASSTVATGVTDGAVKWVRATYATASGDVKFYLSDDGSSWSQLGATVSTAAAAIFASTSDVYVGTRSDNASNPAAGKFYRAQVLDGIGGTTVLDIDTSVITTGSATSFLATTGQTVTISRATSGRKSVAVVSPVWLFGTDDYIETADNALLDVAATDSLTVLAIMRLWATPTSNGRLVDKWDYITAGEPGWSMQTDGTSLELLAYVDDGPDIAQQATAAFTAGRLIVGSMRLDRDAATLSVGFDSTFAANASTSSIGSLANSSVMRIGRAAGSGTGYQDFELIGMALFRRVLSTTEIASIVSYYQSRLT